jgi:MFS family permease
VSVSAGWWREITRYQWLVLLVAWMGWVFDSMDATLYVVVLTPALKALIGAGVSDAAIAARGGQILAVFLIGWAIGGVLFGVFADRVGRTQALIWTILIYAVFTGAAALSRTWWHLMLFRFLTAIGVGGEWAAGAALVAEVWPHRARTIAAGILQSAWAVGVFLAASINYTIGARSWRLVFLVGVLPALVALIVRRNVREPEMWSVAVKGRMTAAGAAFSAGRLRELFQPGLLRPTLVGFALAFTAVFGLWGVTYWTPVLIRHAPDAARIAEALTVQRVSIGVMVLNLGALLGYLVFAPLTGRVGRRWAFFAYFLGSLVMVPVMFLGVRSYTQILWLLPPLGFFTNGVFTGFAIYFPELYPTRLRGTGSGFCFNSARVFASTGPFLTGALTGLFGSFNHAVTAVGMVYLLGMIVLPFAPETRGRELPA